jgi:hypothetical protein
MRLLTLLHSFLTTLKGFIILLIIFMGIGIGFGTTSLQQLNQGSRQFVDTTMLNLLTHWDNYEFFTYTSNGLQQQLTTSQLQQMKWAFNRFGNLLNYQGAIGGIFHSPTAWWQVGARYKILANFEGGRFTAMVTLIKQEGNWAIGRFDYRCDFYPIAKQVGSLIFI